MKLQLDTKVNIPGLALPAFRTSYAVQQGIEKNLIIKTWGGLGDQICAEPTLRFALKTFKTCDVSLASEVPELFRHLEFKKVYDLRREQPNWLEYFPFDTIRPPTDITWQFLCHMLTNCVDYPSLCAFRCQLPVADREVKLEPTREDIGKAIYRAACVDFDRAVIVHPGRHWQSKTFPAWWWNKVISQLIEGGAVPVLIGANTDANRGTVQVDTYGCIDLRSELTVMQTVALLQASKVLVTNDSSPLHMAVAGDTWIGYVATVKHPDYLTHWRKGQWGWRMQNLGRGGIWEDVDYCPNRKNELSAEDVGERLLDWLPEPKNVVAWALEKLAG